MYKQTHACAVTHTHLNKLHSTKRMTMVRKQRQHHNIRNRYTESVWENMRYITGKKRITEATKRTQNVMSVQESEEEVSERVCVSPSLCASYIFHITILFNGRNAIVKERQHLFRSSILCSQLNTVCS